jgi:hypothetical protein
MPSSKAKKNPLNNLQEMGGGGGGTGTGASGGIGRIPGMNKHGGGTVNYYGKKVPASKLKLDMSAYPKKVHTGPNKGQMKFPSYYELPNEKSSLFDRAKAIFNRR